MIKLDFISSFFSLYATYLSTRAKIYMWPVNILAIITNFFLYYKAGIYGHMTLEIFFFFMSIYGWYNWNNTGQKRKNITISFLSSKKMISFTSISLLCTLALSIILHKHTKSNIPFADSFTTIFSLFGQWLTCYKYMQCWIIWFIVDFVHAGLLLYKGLPIHSVMVFTYLYMAISGYLNWKKLYINNA